MTHNQNIITCHYQQLQPYERGLIMARQSDGWSCRRIARELHRNPSTISRELKRGTIRQIGANHRTDCHAVSWLLKAPEFLRQLVIEFRVNRVSTVSTLLSTSLRCIGPNYRVLRHPRFTVTLTKAG